MTTDDFTQGGVHEMSSSVIATNAFSTVSVDTGGYFGILSERTRSDLSKVNVYVTVGSLRVSYRDFNTITGNYTGVAYLTAACGVKRRGSKDKLYFITFTGRVN